MENLDCYNKFNVIAPELDENMNPAIQLQDKSQCPKKGKNGMCHKCHFFMGLITEDGSIFAHGLYEGFCDSKYPPIQKPKE